MIEKHAPWLLSIIALSILMYSDIQNLKIVAKDYKGRADKSHFKHEQAIKKLSDKVIQLENEQKHKLSKEEYYKGIK